MHFMFCIFFIFINSVVDLQVGENFAVLESYFIKNALVNFLIKLQNQ